MKYLRIITCCLIIAALFTGCKAGGEKQAQEKLAAASLQAEQPNPQGQTPYYYGLIEEYRTVLAEDPHNLAATIALGNAYFDAGQWKDAVRHYERALSLDPHNVDVITDLGTSYRNMGFSDRALAQYKKALGLEPLHQNALYNLGIVYAYDRKDYTAAIRVWQQLLHVAPKHPRADYMRSCIVNFQKILRKGHE